MDTITWVPPACHIVTKGQVNEIFDRATDQHDLLINLHVFAVGGQFVWSHVAKLDGHVHTGELLSNYLMRKFIAFDQAHHPGYQAGGLWMSRGFSSIAVLPTLGPWELRCCAVILKDPDLIKEQWLALPRGYRMAVAMVIVE